MRTTEHAPPPKIRTGNVIHQFREGDWCVCVWGDLTLRSEILEHPWKDGILREIVLRATAGTIQEVKVVEVGQQPTLPQGCNLVNITQHPFSVMRCRRG